MQFLIKITVRKRAGTYSSATKSPGDLTARKVAKKLRVTNVKQSRNNKSPRFCLPGTFSIIEKYLNSRFNSRFLEL